MGPYLARICWNSKNWVGPTGEAARCEHNSYVAEAGFGHEEWLFNFAWQLGGKHYAFLQPVANSHQRLAGKAVDLLLFTISPNAQRYYIAELSGAEVVHESDARTALREYRQRGWLRQMSEQLDLVGNLSEHLVCDALSLFNIRFTPEQVRFPASGMAPVRSKFVSTRSRYVLYPVPDAEAEKLTRGRRPTTGTLPTDPTKRRAQPETTVDRTHNALQNHLAELLRAKYGPDTVSVEEDWVDLTLRTNACTAIVEVKTEPDARLAIRSALGQILEYAYYPTRERQKQLELHIVSPAPMTDEVSRYVQILSDTVGLRLSYHPFSLETQTCPT